MSNKQFKNQSSINMPSENIQNKTFIEIEAHLSVRAFNILMHANIRTFGELISKTTSELKRIRYIDSSIIQELIDYVHSFGFRFVDENKIAEPNDNEMESLQTKINEQIQGNEAISDKIEEKRKLLQRGQDLDEQIKEALETLKSLGVKDGQKVK